PIAETPGVGDGVTVGVRGSAAVEADRCALGAGVRSPSRGRRRVIRGRRGVVAQAAPRVGERLPGDGDELPGVRARIQGELEHPPGVRVPNLTVRYRRGAAAIEAGATSAHDEGADAVHRVAHGRRGLGRQALIAVLVPIDYDVRAVRVQGVPQRLVLRVARDVDAGHESGRVPVGERAAPAVEREIVTQPLHLGGGGCYVELAVERDDVPIAEVVAVVALCGIACRGTEVTEVPGSRAIAVLVVTGHGAGPRLVPAPRRGVIARVFGGGTHLVGVVAEREDGARDAVEQVGGEG